MFLGLFLSKENRPAVEHVDRNAYPRVFLQLLPKGLFFAVGINLVDQEHVVVTDTVVRVEQGVKGIFFRAVQVNDACRPLHYVHVRKVFGNKFVFRSLFGQLDTIGVEIADAL